MRHFPARSGHGYPQGWFWKILSSSDIFCWCFVFRVLTDCTNFNLINRQKCPLFRFSSIWVSVVQILLVSTFLFLFFHFLPVCLSVCLSVCLIDNFFILVFLWCDKMEWSYYYIYFFSKKFISAKKMKILHSGRSNAKLVQFSNDVPVVG